MEKNCLDCGSALKGRADKKFCDDQCRSNYNNRIKADESKEVKRINGILHKNRKILIALNPEGKTTVAKQRLEEVGFNFNYHTHRYQTNKGSIYIFCYEYGYLPIENDYYLLVKND
ncbi:hypothetical protein BCY91_16380 [Pelobium manganitolerans]|uniref:DUF2116 family Zn-ribbon domain-containing protein n=1 Tax=Pelobium manganitolerans TaxID=1842495 RepID=A0A419S8B4_9SPHI|nr:hypothetical protein [Pelobium manganitolerans]RKD18018.1 hypothetical protein BCY91_16380 [Pelobium manganitolerans]